MDLWSSGKALDCHARDRVFDQSHSDETINRGPVFDIIRGPGVAEWLGRLPLKLGVPGSNPGGGRGQPCGLFRLGSHMSDEG